MHGKTLAIAALAACLLVGGVTPTYAKEEAPACAPLEAGAAQTITGTGQRSSAPFTLEGGAYRVAWSFVSPTTQLSFVTLKSATDPSVLRSESIVMHPAAGVTSGETFLYNVTPGRHYLDVRAPSDWSVTLTPIVV